MLLFKLKLNKEKLLKHIGLWYSNIELILVNIK